MPVIDWLEVALLHQAHTHIGIVHTHLGRQIPDIDPHSRQHFKKVISFTQLKLGSKVLVPCILIRPQVKFIVKEIVQAFRCLPGIVVLELLKKITHHKCPRLGQERVQGTFLTF